MKRINDLINRKREILRYYRENLQSLKGVSMNPELEGTINGAWMPTIVFDKQTGVTRELLQMTLQQDNIDARVFFYPLSSLPMFEDKQLNVNAWDIPNRAINLPSYNDLTNQDLLTILDCLLNKVKII
jgi:perosamine synthetase